MTDHDCYATKGKGPRRGRPVVRGFTCDICNLRITEHASVLFAQQDGGTGPYVGQSGWYTATVHADPCGSAFLHDVDNDYRARPCRGCGRTMWLRPGSRRTHCSRPCRQSDYRRRRDLAAAALNEGQVLYRDELYWLTRQEAAS